MYFDITKFILAMCEGYFTLRLKNLIVSLIRSLIIALVVCIFKEHGRKLEFSTLNIKSKTRKIYKFCLTVFYIRISHT